MLEERRRVEHDEHDGNTKYTMIFCVADSSLPLRIAGPKPFVVVVVLSVLCAPVPDKTPSGKLSTQVSTRYISFAF